jgi:hypothetical protein
VGGDAFDHSGRSGEGMSTASVETQAALRDGLILGGLHDFDRAGVRRELRRQIGRLEAVLACHTRDLPPEGAATPHGVAAPRVLGVEDLEQIRDALIARLSEVQRTAGKRARREARARARRKGMLHEPERHRWEAVSAAEAGQEGCLDYRVEPRLGLLGMAMNWWRVRVSGGCP